MSDWIHCNKCSLKFRADIKFYLTTCGHLKCQLCVSKMGPDNHCLVCSSLCRKVVLSENLQPDVMLFFQPAVNAMDKAGQVCEFQLTNALSLLKTTIAKYTKIKTEIAKCDKIIHELQMEQHGLKMLLRTDAGAATDIPSPSRASCSMMSGNSSFRGLTMTPASNASSSSFMSSKNPTPRAQPWQQHRNAASMMMHRRQSNVKSGVPSSPDSTYAGSQERSPAPFDLLGSPNLRAHGPPQSRNPRLGPRGNYHLGMGNQPR